MAKKALCIIPFKRLRHFYTQFFAKTKTLAMSPHTGLTVLYGDMVIFAMSRLSVGKQVSEFLKSSFCIGNSLIFGLHNSPRLKIYFFSKKTSA